MRCANEVLTNEKKVAFYMNSYTFSNENIWSKYLSTKRRRQSLSSSTVDARNDFEKDYGRMIFSSVVRRLQGKSQVFPLDPNDFVRTRLTHSVEVSALGRSVGASLENILGDFSKGLVGPLLATAGLVHDLGNPPFGHHGEIAIQEFFRDYFAKNPNVYMQLSDGQKKDFLFFDGNPQTFRLLTRLQWLWDTNGFNLTAATLAATVKYPVNSCDGNQRNENNSHGVEKKKFGFFQSEQQTFEEIWDSCGLQYGQRHPLAFVLEALDDIAYISADIEDGLKKRLITLDDIRDAVGSEFVDRASKIDSFPIPWTGDDVSDILVQRVRIACQGKMIEGVVHVIENRLSDWAEGRFNEQLLDLSDIEWVNRLRKLAKDRLYNAPEVLQLEIAGSRIIEGLLDVFVKAIMSPHEPHTTFGKIYALIPPRLRYIAEQDDSLVSKLQLAVDYITGMTDDYAVHLYQKLSGVSL